MARVHQMQALPVIGILATNARQIRAGALGAPLKGAVIDRFVGGGIMAVALGFEAQCADHLRVTQVAAFAHIDVAPGQAQRRVGLDVQGLDLQRMDVERRDFRQASQGHHDGGAYAQCPGVFFDVLEMTISHGRLLISGRRRPWWRRVVRRWERIDAGAHRGRCATDSRPSATCPARSAGRRTSAACTRA